MWLSRVFARELSATDPAHARLTLAAAVACGMLLSGVGALAIVHLLQADQALLAVGIFLSMQMGLAPKDTTARQRCVTTSLLIFPTIASAALATMLASEGLAAALLFIGIAGVATWARRFGARATALGLAAFYGCFFALLLDLTPGDLPAFVSVVASTVASQTLVRMVLMLQRPRRQIRLLLRELGEAAGGAIAAARQPGWGQRQQRVQRKEGFSELHPPVQRHRLTSADARLVRIDAVARAIADWQQEFDTAQYVACSDVTLATVVLDARVSTEELTSELDEWHHSVPSQGDGMESGTRVNVQIEAALDLLQVVLDPRADLERVAVSARTLDRLVTAPDPEGLVDPLLLKIRACGRAHRMLRDVDLSGGDRNSTSSIRGLLRSLPASAAAPPVKLSSAPVRLLGWRDWQPESRLTVQIMVATSIAAAVGHVISSSHWYWAVLTAFVVFVGVSTRSSVLTRAYGRVLGTALGLLLGCGLVALAHDERVLLVFICIAAVFAMIYWGPIRYLYSAWCLTVALVVIYGLTGQLSSEILALRIGETIAGATIGVLCAYFILSANSRPALFDHVNAYFSAFDGLLRAIQGALVNHGREVELLRAVQQLDRALKALDTFVAATSAAYLVSSGARREPDVHLLYVSTRASEHAAGAALQVTSQAAERVFRGEAALALGNALELTRSAAYLAQVSYTGETVRVDGSDHAMRLALSQPDFADTSPQMTALNDLYIVYRVLEEIARRAELRDPSANTSV